MDRETFEDRIQKKFEGQTLKAPEGIWNEIENSLNAELVSIYASQHLMYKWVSVAAVLIAVVLLGVLYFPTTLLDSGEKTELASYNALLSSDVDFDNYYNPQYGGISNRDLSFRPTGEARPVDNMKEPETDSGEITVFATSVEVEKKNPDLILAEFSGDIYRYRSSESIPRMRDKHRDNKGENRAWAGVEAGAGNFNAGIGGPGALANSINPAGLASAVGSGSFVNPTTSITPNMNDPVATTFGVDFGMKLGQKWTLESGLAYTSVENRGTASINVLDVYTIDNTNFIENSGGPDGIFVPGFAAREATIEVRENYDHEVDLTNRVQFASIPVKAGYFIMDRKFSLRLNAGLSANYLVNGDFSDPSRQIVSSEQSNLYNEWSFDGIGGIELGYSIFSKFDLTIEPNYRHSITPISNSINSPSRFLVQTGLRYTMK